MGRAWTVISVLVAKQQRRCQLQGIVRNVFRRHSFEPPAQKREGARQVPRIEISGLTKRFGSKLAVDNIDLVVEPGQFLVLLGPSGSGKSTLLRCIAGIEAPTGGLISYDEVRVDGPGCHMAPEKRNLAVVFQDYALWPHLTAEQNVSFALERLRISSSERKRRSRMMLEQVGLGGMGGRYPSQLSGGEQQRVGLARALVADPGILLFDEPLSNLDADRRERLRADIGAMVRRNGATAVYITHDQAEAFALADVIGVMNAGRLVQFGTPEEIFRAPVSAFVARFTGLSGELSGHIVGDQDSADRGFIDVDINGYVIKGRPIERPLKLNQAVQVLIRPFALNLLLDDVSSIPTKNPWPQVRVTVLDSAYRGSGYEHVVYLDGQSRLTCASSVRRIPFMSEAVLEIDPEGCLVIASHASSAPTLQEDLILAGEGGDENPVDYMTMAGEF